MIPRLLLRHLPRPLAATATATARLYSSKPSSRSPQSPTSTPAGPGPGLGGSFGDSSPELGVGELSSGKFRVEPLRRHGEDLATIRARLLYQSRKRGILETDLLLSTFADANLASMDAALLHEYDRFLDENDWDIYYWTTQSAPAAAATAAAAGEGVEGPTQGQDQGQGQRESTQSAPAEAVQPAGFGEGPVGEWVQTVGRVREPYRPPPSRWRGSEILGMLRAHVKGRAVGGGEVRGLGRMPDVRLF